MDVFELSARLGLNAEDYNRGIDDAEQKASSFGNALGGAAKVAAAAMAATVTAVAGVTTAFIKGAGEVAEYGDTIDKESQKLGISAEAYQEWDAILQHTGGSVDNLKPALKTLSKEIVNNSEAFQKLGFSQEELMNSSVEEVLEKTITRLQEMPPGVERTRLATELLGRSSVELGALLNTSAEDTEAMRQRVHELGGVMSDEAVKASAAYQDSLQDMQTSIAGVKRGLMSDMLPALTTVMDGITSLFAGEDGGLEMISEGLSGLAEQISEAMPQIAEIASTLLTAFGTAIVENLPMLVEAIIPPLVQTALDIIVAIAEMLPELFTTIVSIIPTLVVMLIEAFFQLLPEIANIALQIVSTLAEGMNGNAPTFLATITQMILNGITTISQNLPQFLQQGSQIVLQLITGLVNMLPQIVQSLVQIVIALVEAIVQNLPMFLETGVQLILALIQGIVAALPQIIQSIIQLVSSLLQTITQNLPQFIQSGIEVVGQLIAGLIQALPDLIAGAGELVMGLMQVVLETDWLSLGWDIITGIASGIANAAGQLLDALWEAVKSAWDTVLSWLGIASPSKRARDIIGKNWALGIGVGFEQNMPTKQIVGAVEGTFDELEDLEEPFLASEAGSVVDRLAIEGDSSGAYPADNVTINVYGAEGQDVEELAEEVQRLFVLWENQRRTAFA